MLKPLRLASEEEVAAIKKQADVDLGCTVLGMDKDLAVLRICHELDPFIMAPESTDRQKVAFVWAIENCLRFTGVPFYYFNIKASDEKWLKNVESFGAQQVSQEPELRFKKIL
jgi:hypothetical protein